MKQHTHIRLEDEVKAADSPYKVAALVIGKYGLIGAIAMFLVWNMTFRQAAAIDRTGEIVSQHVYESRYMQRASCVSLAILAGTPPALCDPPQMPPSH